jgi:hypothetical protein
MVDGIQNSERRHMYIFFKRMTPALSESFVSIWKMYQKHCVTNQKSEELLRNIYAERLNDASLFLRNQDESSRQYDIIHARSGPEDERIRTCVIRR